MLGEAPLRCRLHVCVMMIVGVIAWGVLLVCDSGSNLMLVRDGVVMWKGDGVAMKRR